MKNIFQRKKTPLLSRGLQRGVFALPAFLGSIKPSVGGGAIPGSVIFLSHFDGENGSTGFVDEKGNTFTLTGSGISLDTSQKKFGGASVSGFGSGRSLYVSGINFTSTEDFTIGVWARWDGSSGNNAIFTLPSSGVEILVYNGKFALWQSTGGFSYGGPMPVNQWCFVAIERKDLSTVVTLDGVIKVSVAGSYANSAGLLNIGCYNNSSGSESFGGHIDEMIVRTGGTQFGGGAFTPPTEPFSA